MTPEEAVRRILEDREPVAIDTETEGVRPERHRVAGISLAFGDGAAVYLPFNHHGGGNLPEGTGHTICRALDQRSASGRITVAHNAVFDIAMLANWCALTRWDWHCSQVRECLLHEHDRHDLASTAKRWGGTLKDDGLLSHLAATFGGKATRKVQMPNLCRTAGDDPVVARYARMDARATLGVYARQQAEIERQGLQGAEDTERALTAILVRMRLRGVRVDEDRLAEVAATLTEWAAAETDALGGLNVKSTAQVQDWLSARGVDLDTLPRTDGGSPSVDKHTLQDLGEVAEPILQARAVRTAAATLAGWQELTWRGRLHASVNPMGASTGRMSCSGPNLQTIPHRVGNETYARLARLMRSVFVADEGRALYETDYSQVEFRLSVAYSGDEDLIEAYRHPETDIYQMMADRMGIDRQTAKGVSLALSYSGGVPSIRRFTGLSEREALRVKERFQREFLELTNFAEHAEATSRRRGGVRTLGGNFLHRRQVVSAFDGRLEWDDRKALNKLSQGGASDALKRALITVADRTEADMLLPVHDSLVFQAPVGDTETPAAVQEAFESVAGYFKIPLPLYANTTKAMQDLSEVFDD